MSRKLISGKKEQLLGEFKQLKNIHGKSWRKLLIQVNKWHSTGEAVYAWQNALRGTVGNEALRMIVKDMRSIIKNNVQPKKNVTISTINNDHTEIINSVAAESLRNLGFESSKAVLEKAQHRKVKTN